MYRFLMVALSCGFLTACTEALPSFSKWSPTAWHTYRMDTAHVQRIVMCDMNEFLRKPENRRLLKAGARAEVNLTLKTNLKGQVGYLGVDLDKIGLGGLANFIALKQDAPSLGIVATAQSTVTSKVSMKMEQAFRPETPCGGYRKKFYVADWLETYFKNNPLRSAGTGIWTEKIALTTEFQFVVDIGTNLLPILSSTYIFPIATNSASLAPTNTNQIEIVLMVANDAPKLAEK